MKTLFVAVLTLMLLLNTDVKPQITPSPKPTPHPAKTPIPSLMINLSESEEIDLPDKIEKVVSKENENLYSIAYLFGVSADDVAKYNNLKLEPILKPGTIIKVSIDGKTQKILERSAQAIKKSENFFKQGLLSMQDNRRSQAGEDFNKSVEVFLMSGVNVSRSFKIQSCYSQLIETVYRIEFPSGAQQPQIRNLLATCGWTSDNELADKVAKIVLSAPVETNNMKTNLMTSAAGQINLTQGFNEQKFEASPLDELAKLKLTLDEQQYKYIPYTPRLPNELRLGTKPIQTKDGKIKIVVDFLNETLHDPYTARFVRWSEVSKVTINNEYYWVVTVKYRAKNTFGAYVLTVENFYIQKNKVVRVAKPN